MAFVPPRDRVLEQSTSNSQTVFEVTGALDTSYNAFSATMSIGDTTIGGVVEAGVAFRSGILTYSATNEITVSTTKETKGTFSSGGVKEVFMGLPALAALMVDGVQAWSEAQKLQALSNFGAPQNCGRLSYVSTTAIKFAPYNGDLLKINGSLYRIPAAGVAGLANTSVFVNGTGASNLAASTFYWVYAFVNSGTVTADFRTDGNGHLPSDTAGNIGTEVRVSTGSTKDDTRTLIGMVRTNASSQFVDGATQIFVRSWFNRPAKAGKNAFSVQRSTTSSTFVELNSEIRIEFLCWADENVHVGVNGPAYINSGTYDYVMTSVGFDGTTANDTAASYSNNVAGIVNVGYSFTKGGLSEGYHYATVLGKNSGGSLTARWGDASFMVGLNLGIN